MAFLEMEQLEWEEEHCRARTELCRMCSGSDMRPGHPLGKCPPVAQDTLATEVPYLPGSPLHAA